MSANAEHLLIEGSYKVTQRTLGGALFTQVEGEATVHGDGPRWPGLPEGKPLAGLVPEPAPGTFRQTNYYHVEVMEPERLADGTRRNRHRVRYLVTDCGPALKQPAEQQQQPAA